MAADEIEVYRNTKRRMLESMAAALRTPTR